MISLTMWKAGIQKLTFPKLTLITFYLISTLLLSEKMIIRLIGRHVIINIMFLNIMFLNIGTCHRHPSACVTRETFLQDVLKFLKHPLEILENVVLEYWYWLLSLPFLTIFIL